MCKISILDAVSEYALGHYVPDDVEIDLSDLWVVDFPNLYFYEKEALMELLLPNVNNFKYLVNVLNCRYGHKFRLRLESLFCAYIGRDQFDYVEILDGVIEAHFEEVDLSDNVLKYYIPWLRKSMDAPSRFKNDCRPETTKVILTSSGFAVAETRNVYIIESEKEGDWDEYIEYVSAR